VTRVIVVGGGIAGLGAAREADSLGAKVTLFEQSASILPPRSTWPDLISGGLRPDLENPAIAPPALQGGVVRYGEGAQKVDVADRTVRTPRGSYRYDSIVVASGSRVTEPRFRGVGKKNVFVMGEYKDYVRLGRSAPEFGRAVVGGSGPLSLSIAEKLNLMGVKVTLLAPNGILSGYVTESIRQETERRALEAGLQVSRSPLEGVVGVEKVEAVLAGSNIHASEALIFFPAPIPNTPSIAVDFGSKGGILVDDHMRSSDGRVYAAGDCAEVRFGSFTSPVMFDSAAQVMGRVAGANAAGRPAAARVSGTVSHKFFGLDICYGGIGLEEAKGRTIEVSEAAAGDLEDPLLCALLFEGPTLVVRGVQMGGRGASSFSDVISLILSKEMKLPELAYQEFALGSQSPSDISPISIAALAGLSRRRSL